MKVIHQSESETNAAEQSAGRELLTATLQRNPLVSLATALIGPVLGLFKGRSQATPTSIEKLKLERYSSRPVARPYAPSGHINDGRVKEECRKSEGRMSSRLNSGPTVRAKLSRNVKMEGGCYHG